MKKYILFAGVNGAGKTTLFQTVGIYKELPRVNMDEIVREFGSWKNGADVLKAGKIAVRKVEDFFTKGESFNQETTLCGHSILKNIETARNLGYEVELYYVGLSSVNLAKQRVEQRVRNGGHGIPPKDIERRYIESLENLKKIILICDRVKIYDNTQSFRKVASYIRGECKDCVENPPEWCDIFLQEQVRKTQGKAGINCVKIDKGEKI